MYLLSIYLINKISELTEIRNELDEHGDSIYDLENALAQVKKEKEELIKKSNNALASAAAENAKTIQTLKKQQDDELKAFVKKNKEAIKLERIKILEAEKLISDAESYRSEVIFYIYRYIYIYNKFNFNIFPCKSIYTISLSGERS